jgi:hypothetical protein
MNTSTKSLQLLALLIADFCNKICHKRTHAAQQGWQVSVAVGTRVSPRAPAVGRIMLR